MLYHIVKPIIRFALLFFCKKIYFNTTKFFSQKGPLLLAVNHPNSFLDAIIIGCHFKQPVYFLARGDAFKNKWALKILTALKCIPVYRLREGKEFLHLNDDSFTKCKEIFKKGGIVLIFTEGLCENEWNIRPLKKGTARLAFSSWEIPEIGEKLQILPVGITFNSYTQLPKKVWVNFGEIITKDEFDNTAAEGTNFLILNEKIMLQWQQLCIDGVGRDKSNTLSCYLTANSTVNFAEINKVVATGIFQESTTILNQWSSLQKPNWTAAITTSILALPSYMFVFPFYYCIKKIVSKKASRSVHYDSILLGLVTLCGTLLLTCYFVFSYIFWQNFLLSISIICLLAISSYFLTVSYISWHKIYHHYTLQNEQKIALQRLFN